MSPPGAYRRPAHVARLPRLARSQTSLDAPVGASLVHRALSAVVPLV